MPIVQRHSAGDLAQMQSLQLGAKIQMSKRRICEWYDHWNGDVYVSFSGGKDSTVVLNLVRSIFPEVPAVFVDTGLEYPEVREFVKRQDNVIWLKPEMNFKEVVKTYGYPVATKEIAKKIKYAREGVAWAQKFIDGTALDKEGRKSRYCVSKRWLPLMNAPFEVSSYCCDIMKKHPTHKFERENGLKPILGLLATESKLREQAWMRAGCNAFDTKKPRSTPIAFWTEQDVLQDLHENHIPIAKCYGDIVLDDTQLRIDLSTGKIKECETLKTTGADRTGCMFCMFGAHLEKSPNRFERMKIEHPKQYEWMLKSLEDGGLGLKEVLDYIHVKY